MLTDKANAYRLIAVLLVWTIDDPWDEAWKIDRHLFIKVSPFIARSVVRLGVLCHQPHVHDIVPLYSNIEKVDRRRTGMVVPHQRGCTLEVAKATMFKFSRNIGRKSKRPLVATKDRIDTGGSLQPLQHQHVPRVGSIHECWEIVLQCCDKSFHLRPLAL